MADRSAESPVQFSVHMQILLHGHVHVCRSFAADAIGNPLHPLPALAGPPASLSLSQLSLQVCYCLLVPHLRYTYM